MKKIYMLSALMCASVFSFTGCIEETFENPVPANDGDEIVFGARAGFENRGTDTKTIYAGGGGFVTENDFYSVNDKKFERIDWIDGTDRIQISCPEAGGVNPAHYLINDNGVHDKENDFAYLTKTGDSSLQWNGDDVHHFYAMYPSSEMFNTDQSTLAQGIKMSGTTLNGTVPGAQTPVSITQVGNDWIAAPDMKYAYMAARSTAKRSDGSVSLSFVPIVTAVQIQLTLTGTDIHPVSIGEIQVVGDGIAGNFTADLAVPSNDSEITATTEEYTGWPTSKAYPKCTNEGAGVGIIQVPVWVNNKPIELTAGQSLIFTVFLRPGADYTNLKVNYSPTGSGYIGKTMGSSDKQLTIPRNLKTVVEGFKLPAILKEKPQITIDASKWMSQLAGETAMKKLSIPGTGGSFSFNYNSTNPGWYKQQTLTLEQQWAAGIRAFEIVSDRPSTATTTLGTQDVKCNKVSMGITVIEVLEDLLEKTASIPEGETGPTECAVLILTYQPEGNSPNRNGASYATSLKAMYDGLTDTQKAQIIQYKLDLTLAQAKGKVMIFCRINQKDERDNGDTTEKSAFELATSTLSGTNITLINGCGTGKDRWGSRGYKVNGNIAYDAANTGDSNKSVDYYLTQTETGFASWSWPDWSNVTKPVAANGDLNFGFTTNYSDVVCWYQEWARVVPESIIDLSTGWYHVKNTVLGILDIYADYRWYESYNEKVAAAKETFNMAISDTYPSYVFINSLCGYLVDPSIESSYTIFTGTNTGGIAGNIKGLADKLNPAFYQYVLGAGMEQTTGPTGIVMMDYVTNTPTEGVDYDGSYYLPGVIIANNFKHGSGNGSNTGGGNQGNQGEGDNDTPGDEGDGF